MDIPRRHLGIALAAAISLVVPLAALHMSAGTVSAASCNKNSHKAPTLSSGRASPGTGTPSSTIVFTVRYADSIGCSPSAVDVVITGVGRYRMTAGGTSYKSGVTFRFARRLPAGRWSYRFTAASGSGAGKRSASLTSVSPSRVVIKKPAAPAPQPNPTPRPTAKPQSKPKPKPATRPTPTKGPTAAASSTAGPSASPDGQAAVTSPRASSSDDGIAFLPFGPDDDGGSGLRGGGGDPRRSSNATPFGLGIDPNIGIPVAVWSITTACGVLVFAMGLLPVRRRRDPSERGWRPSLAGVARALGSPPRADIDPVQQPAATGAAKATIDASLSAVRQPLRFHAPPRGGVERRTIAYRFVRVADQPDDTTSSEVCRLDRGDEIEIIGEHEGFLKIVTPNGLQGWVQRVVIVG